MKTRNLIIICILAIFCCLIFSFAFTTANDTNNDYLNESNYTYDLNSTYNISEDLDVNSNDYGDNSKSNVHREHYTREKGYYVSEDEYYDTYDYGDNYEIDDYLESGGELYYED